MPRRSGSRRWMPYLPPTHAEDRDQRATPIFRDGKKYLYGVAYVMVGFRQSLSSDGVTTYTAIMWSDGKASCNCPGWATSKTRDKFGNPKEKTCRHSRDVREGDAV